MIAVSRPRQGKAVLRLAHIKGAMPEMFERNFPVQDIRACGIEDPKSPLFDKEKELSLIHI